MVVEGGRGGHNSERGRRELVSWQKESVHASIKASITRSGNCRTVIDAMSALKSTPRGLLYCWQCQKRLLGRVGECCVNISQLEFDFYIEYSVFN
jgi:hypothetical protein